MTPDHKILVVDDDASTRDVLVRALTDEGYDAAGVASTMESLKLLDGGARFALLVIDVMMPPGMPHGFALARMVRSRNADQRIIYISGMMEGLPSKEIERLEDPILSKPVHIADFLEAVHKALHPVAA